MSKLVEDKRFELLNKALELVSSAGADKWPDFNAWQNLREAAEDLNNAEKRGKRPRTLTLKEIQLKYYADCEGLNLEDIFDEVEDPNYTVRDWVNEEYIESTELQGALLAAFKLGLKQCADFILDDISADMTEEQLATSFFNIQPPTE